MEYTYLDLVNDLETGREIEFFLNSEKYSISHNNGGWYLTKFSEPDIYQSFKNHQELLVNAVIEHKNLEKIWGMAVDVTIY
jgi:hypothetical protein